MQINRTISSPNFEPVEIPVEFLVLHYTAGDLASTLNIFSDPTREVSSQLVLDVDGQVYELVKCWDGTTYRAHHAGRSWWFDGTRRWESFNNFAIGIEIVNLNGHVLPYTEEQYQALAEIVAHLRSLYPALNSAERVVGHEDIAGWRGKADPGSLFDWSRFFRDCYPDQPAPLRATVCPPDLQIALQKFSVAVPQDKATATNFWHALSYMTETSVRLMQEAKQNSGVRGQESE